MLVFATALSGAAAGVAQAADKPGAKPLDFTVHAEAPSAITPNGVKSTKWDARKGRWGLTLNMEQPDARPSTWNDVAAGAYYRITPSIRIGGAVAFGEQQVTPGPQKITPDEGQPRVRLESTFKF